MYLRTTNRKNRDGSVVEYYQLAHNERDPVTRKPVARVIYRFGRADQLDRDQLVRLCKSIARVCNVEVIDLFDADEPFALVRRVAFPSLSNSITPIPMGRLWQSRPSGSNSASEIAFAASASDSSTGSPMKGPSWLWWPTGSANRKASWGYGIGGFPPCISLPAGTPSSPRCTRPWTCSLRTAKKSKRRSSSRRPTCSTSKWI